MNFLKKMLGLSEWAEVYDASTEGGRARSCLLGSSLSLGVVNGLTKGVFLSGFLMNYGINIVNISIISIAPYVASLFSLFTPYILERMKHRRTVLTVSRILYYAINILGMTWLPQLIQSESGRIAGLIAITFVSNAINYLFSSGYSAWHMPYITPDVRNAYYPSLELATNLSSNLLMIVASIITDRLQGQAQQNVIIAMRYVAFAVALLDVYLMQKPREPEYETSTRHPSLLDIIRLPLSNKKFRLTMLIYGLYIFSFNMATSVQHTWMLESVGTGYLYINVINFLYCFFIVGTTGFWSRFTKKHGTFKAMAFSLLFQAPTFLFYSLTTADNYMIMLTIARLSMHAVSLSVTIPLNHLMYVNTPEADRTNYLSFHTIVGNITIFLGMSFGTYIVAAMGDSTWSFFGHPMGGVPTVLLLKGTFHALLAVFILLNLKRVQPDVVR